MKWRMTNCGCISILPLFIQLRSRVRNVNKLQKKGAKNENCKMMRATHIQDWLPAHADIGFSLLKPLIHASASFLPWLPVAFTCARM